jgi:flagellar protein FlbD
MIHLTRLNNRPFVVNADLIKFIENAPDTVITLLTGEKLVVRESVEEVLDRVHDFHIHSFRRIAPGISTESHPNSGSPGNASASISADEEKPGDE